MTIGSVCDSDRSKPRVISELKKSSFHKRRLVPTNSLEHDARPKISGELLWSATPTQWHVKVAEVRQGSLIVHCSSTGAPEFRLPLHHLNVKAGRTPRTFTLSTGHGISLATFQTLTEEEYQRWVRVLAVEVLRQTPLQDVRFLDIIGITRNEEALRRGRSEECLSSSHCSESDLESEAHVIQNNHRNKYNYRDDAKKTKERVEFSQWLHCVKRETEEENKNKNMDFDMKNMKIRRAQRIRPKLPFADTWNKLHGYPEINSPKILNPSLLTNRSVSLEDLPKRVQPWAIESVKCTRIEEKKPVSDESGISSGDENNNMITDSFTKPEDTSMTESIYVSVREKKQFFESLSDEKVLKRDKTLNRSNSIGNIDSSQHQSKLRRNQRASSMQNLSNNPLPVKEMRRFFEPGKDLSKSYDELRFDESSTIMEEEETSVDDNAYESINFSNGVSNFVNPMERKPKESVSYANIQFVKKEDTLKSVRFEENNSFEQKEEKSVRFESGNIKYTNVNVEIKNSYSFDVKNIADEDSKDSKQKDMSTLLIQRKLQRGERKLGKLRIQIAEVEETIKIIAEDLHSIGPETLKRRSGLEVFAALRRRLEEETSRLERLQEETAKVITDNQRTILKMGRR